MGNRVHGILRNDGIYGGLGSITGVITELQIPGRYRVRLYHQTSGLLIRETWSDVTTGAYAFTYLDTTLPFAVVTHDHTNPLQNAEIQDRVYATLTGTVVNLNLGGTPTPGVACGYDLKIRPFTSPGGSCPYGPRIGGLNEYTATLAATLNDDAGAAAGNFADHRQTATLAATLTDDAPVFNGNVLSKPIPPAITATLTTTLANDTLASVGVTHPAGRLAATSGADVATGSATYAVAYLATITASDGADRVVGQGDHGAPPATYLQTTLANDTLAGAGTVTYNVTATWDLSLGDDVAALTGELPYRGDLLTTLSDDTLAGFSAFSPNLESSDRLSLQESGALVGDLHATDLLRIEESSRFDFSLTQTSAESWTLLDRGALRLWASSFDGLDLVESSQADFQLTSAVEWIEVAEDGSALLTTTWTAEDLITLRDTGAARVFLTSSDRLALAEAGSVRVALSATETLALSDRGAFNVAWLPAATDSIALTDVGTLRPWWVSGDTLALADLSSLRLSASLASAETWGIAEAGSALFQQALRSSDLLTLAEDSQAALAITVGAEETLEVIEWPEMTAGDWIPDTGACWVLQTDRLAVSRYDHMPFTSIVQFGDHVLCAGPSGLYRQNGTTDGDTAITAGLETGLNDYGVALLKRLPNATLVYSLETDLSLTLTVLDHAGNRDSFSYTVAKAREGAVKLGRGVTFRYRKLRISGPAPWTLSRLDEYPDVLSRRYAGV